MDLSWLETAEAEELLWGLMIRGMGMTYLIVAWGLYNQVCTHGGRRSMAGRTVVDRCTDCASCWRDWHHSDQGRSATYS